MKEREEKENISDLKNSHEMKLSYFSIEISLYLGVTNNQIAIHLWFPDNCQLKYTELVQPVPPVVAADTKLEYNWVVYSMNMAQKQDFFS